ncbi:MAG: membrane protein of unknown function [Candidatus Thorarchaeota archaeon]|nr:MAG: membrane protein of unknown function [Candidatus Thorarchaeota archaeon]
MAFGLLHYLFLVSGVLIIGCILFLSRRYSNQKNTLTLVFTLFLISYAIIAFAYGFRGLFDPQTTPEIILWILTNLMYPIMVVPLAVFLAYPYLQEKIGTPTGLITRIIMIFAFLVVVFNWGVIFTSDIEYTYIDVFGLTHYSLVSDFVPYAYYLTLFLDIVVATFSAIFLAISFRRETDSVYKQKALFLLVGWLLISYGQLLLLSATLAIIHPLTSMSGVILLVLGVVRSGS